MVDSEPRRGKFVTTSRFLELKTMRQHGTAARYLAIGLALTAHVILFAAEPIQRMDGRKGVARVPSESPDAAPRLGPAPRLAPVTRFVAPVDPWEPGGLGWGVEGLDEEGIPLCVTNHPPATACDAEGPRAFLHVGFDARPAADRVVRASAAGRVVVARRTTAPVTGRSLGEGAGLVVLEHDLDGDPATGDDRLLTVYGHVEPQVAVGAIAAQGEPIALTSTFQGDHLHFAVRRAPFDPADPDVYRSVLPPDGTNGCVACYSNPMPVPAFPDRWEDPDALLRGQSSWLAIYGDLSDAATDVVETGAGHVAFGYTFDQPGAPGRSMAVRMLDQDGGIVSQRAYYTTGLDTIRHVEPTQDGGVIALARAASATRPGRQVPMLVKFDAAMEPQWARRYEAASLSGGAFDLWWEDIAVTGDGGYVVTGTVQMPPLSAPTASAAVARLDAAGNVLWLRSYPPGLVTRGIDGKGIAQTSDGGFVVVAEFHRFLNPPSLVAKDLLVLRLDADGGLLWGTTVSNGLGDARAGQIEATPDGGSIVVGYRTSGPFTPPTRVWMLKLDADGVVAWSSLFGSDSFEGFEQESGTRLVVAGDGGFVVGGNRRSITFGPEGPEFYTRLFVMRLDQAGEILGTRQMASIGEHTTMLGLRAAADGGFIVAGGADADCRLCNAPSAEAPARFVVGHLDADLETSAGCTTPIEFLRVPLAPTGSRIEFGVVTLVGTPVETALTRVETTGRRYPCGDRAFGPPPVFEATTIDAAQTTASCDRTQYLEDLFCSEAVEVHATQPVILNVTYDSLRMEARVVDGDSTPEQSDLVEVEASLQSQGTGNPVRIPLLDDGSLTNVSEFFDYVESCFEDPVSGVCTCGHIYPPTFSGDAVPGDGVYARQPSLSLPPFPSAAVGCIIEVSPRRPLLDFARNTPLFVTLKATDRIGNVSLTGATVMPLGASVSCTGDACGCCLLVSRNPLAECSGLPGMPGPDYPDGVCMAF
jgi:hypothetical protein